VWDWVEGHSGKERNVGYNVWERCGVDHLSASVGFVL